MQGYPAVGPRPCVSVLSTGPVQELPGCPGPLLRLAASWGLRPVLRGPPVSAPKVSPIPCPSRSCVHCCKAHRGLCVSPAPHNPGHLGPFLVGWGHLGQRLMCPLLCTPRAGFEQDVEGSTGLTGTCHGEGGHKGMWGDSGVRVLCGGHLGTLRDIGPVEGCWGTRGHRGMPVPPGGHLDDPGGCGGPWGAWVAPGRGCG